MITMSLLVPTSPIVGAARDCKVYSQKFNISNCLRPMRELRDPQRHRIDLRQYNVLGQAQGYSGWYS